MVIFNMFYYSLYIISHDMECSLYSWTKIVIVIATIFSQCRFRFLTCKIRISRKRKKITLSSILYIFFIWLYMYDEVIPRFSITRFIMQSESVNFAKRLGSLESQRSV